MNIKKSIAAALVAAGFICQASADNVVYLTGSTAFRGTVYAQLHSGTNVFDSGPDQEILYKYTAGKENGASYMLFHGNVAGTPTYVDCAWSGSEAGIASAANTTLLNGSVALAGSPETWLRADGTVTASNTNAPTSSQLETNSHGADLATADTSQAVSWTPYVANTSTALKDYGAVGICTFTWLKNSNSAPNAAWTNLKNISTYQMQALLAAPQPAALLTGVATDTNYVYVVGRNKGSGTRANVLADSGYGIKTEVNQFSIGGTNLLNSGTPSTLILESVLNDGYESGGNVVNALKIDLSCGQTDPFTGYPGWIAVGYAGCSDAAGLAPTVNWLTENGVLESNGTVIEGQYSFWGNEHVLGKHGISSFQDTVGTRLANGVKKTLNATTPVLTNHDAGIGLNWMHCAKSDTGTPTRL